MAEEQKENQAQNGTQETRLPLSIDRSKEISKYMNVFNASFAYNEVFLEMGSAACSTRPASRFTACA